MKKTKLSQKRLRHIYNKMRQRCLNVKNKDYHYYGGRGITISKKWETLEAFRKWAYENGYNDSSSLDRKNNEQGYTPENCRWTTKTVQCINRRKFKNSKSNHIGVSKDGKIWVARLGYKGKRYYLGAYKNEEAAAFAYNVASKIYHKEFKNENKIKFNFNPSDEFVKEARILLKDIADRTCWDDAINILNILITPPISHIN